jgi:hypothetical protein
MDIKGTLWALAVCLLLIIWLMSGCRSGLDRFRENREQRREDRQQWWNQWQDRRDERQQKRDEHHDERKRQSDQDRSDPWWKRRRGNRDASIGSKTVDYHFAEFTTWSIDRLGGCAAAAM